MKFEVLCSKCNTLNRFAEKPAYANCRSCKVALKFADDAINHIDIKLTIDHGREAAAP